MNYDNRYPKQSQIYVSNLPLGCMKYNTIPVIAAIVANRATAIKTTAIVFRRLRVNGERAETLVEVIIDSGSHVLQGSLNFAELPEMLTL